MEELKQNFPDGMTWKAPYDPTVFVRDSISAVVHTLLEAVLLVVLVVILFLQTWRASIIPLLAVPISIVGTFAAMYMFGFSINALSLFGLVLAIGIVVDDAIVVVENVERNIENGLSPRDATLKAMREITDPIIAIALTLFAVFVPIAFISGLTGEFYRQFALTIAFSTVISAFNSLTLSPALAALLLKGHDAPKDRLTKVMDGVFGRFFAWFNRVFRRASENYGKGVTRILGRKSAALGVYALLLAATYVGFQLVAPGFVPIQDKQYLVSFAQLPDGATLDRTEKVIRDMSDIAMKEPGVDHAVACPGLSGVAISQKLQAKYAAVKDAYIAIFPPPPVQGMGTIGGFKLQVEDRTDLGYDSLDQVMKTIQAKAAKTPELAGVFSGYKVSVPQLFADLDRTQAMQLGVDVQDVFDSMQIYLGSQYVDDFNKFGRTYQVIAQADAPYRANADNIAQLKVRNVRGEMVPLGSVLTMKQSYGPDQVTHYNGYPAADISGSAAPGVSAGAAVQTMERLANQTLPNGIGYEWTELTYQQKLAGNTAVLVFPLCILLVFLVLAAQYESWSLPLVIVLIVTMSLVSAIAGVWLTGGDNNVFTQIGLLVLVGLACKNAILIVEFARDLERQGRDRFTAALEAARIRLRPILMTSFAFIAGVIPLIIASGAGAEMRKVMGIAAFSGMLGVTFLGLLFTPLFYVLVRGAVDR